MNRVLGLAALLLVGGASVGCAEDEGLDPESIAGEIGSERAAPASDAGAPSTCKTPNPAGVCRTSPDQCIPSSCGCSEGRWICTTDCGTEGGACATPVPVPTPTPTTCEGPSPAGVCRTSPDQCIPSSCGCSEGRWTCTTDCGGQGATCAAPNPAPAPKTCGGPSPAATCRKSAEQCIPSSCTCTDGRWACTRDCGGGTSCDPDIGPPVTCKGGNPALTCRTSPDQCIPSRCGCNDGRWTCTDDCGGGLTCGFPPRSR